MKELAPYQKGLTWKGYLAGQMFTLAGMSAIANGVEGGIKSELTKISDTLGAEFNYSMSLVISQLEAQQRIFENILDKLDEIHKTLNSPLLTQARELCKMGLERLSRGLLDKSLEAFLESEKKNDTDFLVQLQIGKLYLYGKNDDDDVIDFDEAEKHLKLACRYSESEVNFLNNGNNNEILADVKRLCGESFFHVGALYLIRGNEASGSSGEPYYPKAMISFEKASLMNPDFAESFYSVAKSAALLNDKAKCIEYFKKAVKHDMKYLKKVTLDQDFDSVREKINIEAVNKEFETKKNEAMAKYQELKTLMLNIDSAINKCDLFCKSSLQFIETNGSNRNTLSERVSKETIEEFQTSAGILLNGSRILGMFRSEEVVEKCFEDPEYFKQYAEEQGGWLANVKYEDVFARTKYGLKREVRKLIREVEPFVSKDSISGYEKAIDLINMKFPDYKSQLVKIEQTIENLIQIREQEDEEKKSQQIRQKSRKSTRDVLFIIGVFALIIGFYGFIAGSTILLLLLFIGMILFVIGLWVESRC